MSRTLCRAELDPISTGQTRDVGEGKMDRRCIMPSTILVTFQFASLSGVWLLGPGLPGSPLPQAMVATALALGIWSILTVWRRSFRVLPEPKTGATLIEKGPYRRIRHPMYAALLLAAAGYVLDAPGGGRIISALALATVLGLKVRREERMLLARYPDYAAYRARTHRIVPGLF